MVDERQVITRWRRAQFRRREQATDPEPQPEPEPEPDRSES